MYSSCYQTICRTNEIGRYTQSNHQLFNKVKSLLICYGQPFIHNFTTRIQSEIEYNANDHLTIHQETHQNTLYLESKIEGYEASIEELTQVIPLDALDYTRNNLDERRSQIHCKKDILLEKKRVLDKCVSLPANIHSATLELMAKKLELEELEGMKFQILSNMTNLI